MQRLSFNLIFMPFIPFCFSLRAEQRWRSRYSDWLRAGKRRGRSSGPGNVKNCLQVVQTGSGAHIAPYAVATERSISGGKAAGA
jgi:hypothetical protein